MDAATLSLNLYSFVQNDPLNRTDPSGLTGQLPQFPSVSALLDKGNFNPTKDKEDEGKQGENPPPPPPGDDGGDDGGGDDGDDGYSYWEWEAFIFAELLRRLAEASQEKDEQKRLKKQAAAYAQYYLDEKKCEGLQ